MDRMSVASAAVKKNLGPDPSMGRKVELLRRLVSMRQEKGPKAGIPRPGAPSGRPRSPMGVPTHLPARKPADLASQPGYTFGRS